MRQSIQRANRRHSRVQVGLAVAVAVAASVALGSALAAPGQSQGNLREPSQAQTNAFGVLRQPVATNLPASVTSVASDRNIADTYAPDPQLTRVTHPRGDASDPWYITPGPDSICFYAQKEQQGACTTLAEATARGLLVWGVPPGTNPKQVADVKQGARVVFGLVPDDVVSAMAIGADGAQPAQIDDNVLRVSGHGITSLRLETNSGTRQVNLSG